MATTQTKTDAKLDDLFDVQGALDRWNAASRKAGNDYLDLYEKAVGELAELEVKAADAVKLPAVASIAKTHADVTRQIAEGYVSTARQLLNA